MIVPLVLIAFSLLSLTVSVAQEACYGEFTAELRGREVWLGLTCRNSCSGSAYTRNVPCEVSEEKLYASPTAIIAVIFAAYLRDRHAICASPLLPLPQPITHCYWHCSGVQFILHTNNSSHRGDQLYQWRLVIIAHTQHVASCNYYYTPNTIIFTCSCSNCG